MLDFSPLRNKEITINELCGCSTVAELRDLTNEMIDTMLGLSDDCVDDDVIFMPVDPKAYDRYAGSADDVDVAWTLGHVIVHVTASAEESAFLAAEQARGVERAGRSRYEVPWETLRTVEQCRQRLETSRRMRLASLELWPENPHLDNTSELPFLQGPINPLARFCVGLMHDAGHLEQIQEIVRQAKAARSG